MKKRFNAVSAVALASAMMLAACGGEFDDDSQGDVSGSLIIPRALLDSRVSKIQFVVLSGASGRDSSRLLSACQNDNLGTAFKKSDLVKISSGGELKRALAKDISPEELESGVSIKLKVETGTNYLFICEIIGTADDGSLQVIANGSSIYEKVAKGDNKALSLKVNQLDPAYSCSPLIK